MHKLKDLQIDNGDEDTLLGIGRVLGATLESVAQGGSSITKAIDRAIHDTLNDVGGLDEKVMGSLGDAASKVINQQDTQSMTPLRVSATCSMAS